MNIDQTPTPPLILASSSAYRRELLQRLGLAFSALSPDIDERPLPDESPRDLALRLAREKALAVAIAQPAAVVIGSDQVLACGDEMLGKPGNRANAVAQLRHLSGRAMCFYTALCVVSDAGAVSEMDCVLTHVRFRTLAADEIERYLDEEPAYDCAGSCKAEGLGITLCESISSDDPTAIIGLPLIALRGMLARRGITRP